jgi:hypothetical protein
MKFASFLLEHSNGLPDTLDVTESTIYDLTYVENESYYSDLCSFLNIHFNSNPSSSHSERSVQICLKVFFKNTLYKNEYYITVETNGIFEFYKIFSIMIVDKNCFLVTKKVIIEGFKEHFRGFIIGKQEILCETKIINIETLKYLPINKHKISSGKFAFKLRII